MVDETKMRSCTRTRSRIFGRTNFSHLFVGNSHAVKSAVHYSAVWKEKKKRVFCATHVPLSKRQVDGDILSMDDGGRTDWKERLDSR